MAARTIRTIIEGQELLWASGSTHVSDAARMMKRRQVGAITVVEAGKLVGIFTERDALFRVVAEGRDPTTTPIAEVMTPNPRTISPDKPFASALHMMHEGRFRHVPVVDENERPIGMISARDAMGPELEQFIYAALFDEQARDVLA